MNQDIFDRKVVLAYFNSRPREVGGLVYVSQTMLADAVFCA